MIRKSILAAGTALSLVSATAFAAPAAPARISAGAGETEELGVGSDIAWIVPLAAIAAAILIILIDGGDDSPTSP